MCFVNWAFFPFSWPVSQLLRCLSVKTNWKISGYGNIAPKTNWGRVVTIMYALIGMPLFLLWVSQMGSVLASLFKVFYYKVCCGLCRRGKRRKALALAAKNKKQEEKLQAAILDDDFDDEKSLRCLTSSMLTEEGGAVKTLASTPLHLTQNLLIDPSSPKWDILKHKKSFEIQMKFVGSPKCILPDSKFSLKKSRISKRSLKICWELKWFWTAEKMQLLCS